MMSKKQETADQIFKAHAQKEPTLAFESPTLELQSFSA